MEAQFDKNYDLHDERLQKVNDKDARGINFKSLNFFESEYDDDEDVSPSNVTIPYQPDPYDPTLTTNYDFHVLFNYPIPLTDLPTYDPPTHDTTIPLECFHFGMGPGILCGCA